MPRAAAQPESAPPGPEPEPAPPGPELPALPDDGRALTPAEGLTFLAHGSEGPARDFFDLAVAYVAAEAEAHAADGRLGGARAQAQRAGAWYAEQRERHAPKYLIGGGGARFLVAAPEPQPESPTSWVGRVTAAAAALRGKADLVHEAERAWQEARVAESQAEADEARARARRLEALATLRAATGAARAAWAHARNRSHDRRGFVEEVEGQHARNCARLSEATARRRTPEMITATLDRSAPDPVPAARAAVQESGRALVRAEREGRTLQTATEQFRRVLGLAGVNPDHADVEAARAALIAAGLDPGRFKL